MVKKYNRKIILPPKGKDLSEHLANDIEYQDETYISFTPPPSVDVDFFKDNFLQGFVDQDSKVILDWVENIGNPHTRVNLTNSEGETVTWVPQISYGLDSIDDSTLDIDASNFAIDRDQHASSADARFIKAIERNVRAAPPKRSDIEQWKKLLTFFGVSKTPEESSAGDEHHHGEGGTEDDYEDF